MRGSGILFLFALLFGIALAQAQEPSIPALAQPPPCAAECLSSALAGGLCSPTDRLCLCTDPVFQLNVTQCTTASCTIPDALAARNASLTNCGAPVRDRSGNILSCMWAAIIIGTSFIILRFFYKIFIADRSTIGLDDWLLLSANVSGNAAALVHLIGSIPQGLGKDIWTLEPQQITSFGAYFYHSCWTYFQASALIKMTMIALFMRIFPQPKVQRLLWGSFIFTGCYGAAFVITAIFQCSPVHYFWTGWDGLHSGSCANANAIGWANAIGGIVLDFWILGIPLWQLRHLQLHWKRKVAVTIMLMVGAFVTVVSILRLQSLLEFATSHNRTWDFYYIAIWSGFEISIGTMCASLPTMRLLLITCFPRLGDPGNSYKGNYRYHSSDRSGGDSQKHGNGSNFGGTPSITSKSVAGSSVKPASAYPVAYTRETGQMEGDEMSLFHVERGDPWASSGMHHLSRNGQE